jgi:hypothetical protein
MEADFPGSEKKEEVISLKKRFGAFLCVLLSVLLCGSLWAAPVSDQKLTEERCAVLWIGGRQLGDMVIGAEGHLVFQLVDRVLAGRIYSQPDNFPEQIVWNAQYIDKASKAKCDLVILVYRAVNRWTFDPALLKVNDEPLEKKYVLSSLLSAETGNLPKGTEDVLAFGVPRTLTRPGKTLKFSYGDLSVTLNIPKR